jgi:hypothetical protein
LFKNEEKRASHNALWFISRPVAGGGFEPPTFGLRARKGWKDHAGLLLDTYFVIGHPNETRETAQKTIDLAADLNSSSIAVGTMVPYPGTRVYEMAKKGEGGYHLILENWSRYDKSGANILELEGLSLKEIQKFQKRAYWALYLRNRRFADLLVFLWQKRQGIFYLISAPVKSVLMRFKQALGTGRKTKPPRGSGAEKAA